MSNSTKIKDSEKIKAITACNLKSKQDKENSRIELEKVKANKFVDKFYKKVMKKIIKAASYGDNRVVYYGPIFNFLGYWTDELSEMVAIKLMEEGFSVHRNSSYFDFTRGTQINSQLIISWR